MENTKHRKQIHEAHLHGAVIQISEALKIALKHKGSGTLSSTHEILGIVTEEYLELVDAVRANEQREVKEELLDIAVACVMGIACIDAETLDW